MPNENEKLTKKHQQFIDFTWNNKYQPQWKYVLSFALRRSNRHTIKMPQKKKVLDDFYFLIFVFIFEVIRTLIWFKCVLQFLCDLSPKTATTPAHWNPSDIYKSLDRWRQISTKYASAKNLNKHCYFYVLVVHMKCVHPKWRDIIEKMVLMLLVVPFHFCLLFTYYFCWLVCLPACRPDLLICTTISLQLFFLFFSSLSLCIHLMRTCWRDQIQWI